MSIFGGANGPTKINSVSINQSVQGFPVVVIMGRYKTQQALIWMDGFTAKKVSSGGKGLGGAKGSEYDYTADVIAALCDGGANGIVGIGDVWSGQSWLSNNSVSESYTISGSSPSYTPTNSSAMSSDEGVGISVTQSGTYSDLLSGGTSISSTSLAPFERVPYGDTLGSGQYSVDSSNAYHFSTFDNGKTVSISYSFTLKTVKKQTIGLIPSGKTIAVGGTVAFSADVRVIYYSTDGSDPLNGTQMTKVSGTPMAAGTYSVSGSGPATYTFAAADIGKEVQITYLLNDSASLPTGASTTLSFIVFEGKPGQGAWSLLVSNYPGAALGYPGIALAAYTSMDLGTQAQVQQNELEVITADGWGAGVMDCNPVQCILQVLSNKVWGLGRGKIPFPVSAIDNGPGGTWGSGGPGGGNGAQAYQAPASGPGTAIAESTATAWFAANSFFISVKLDRQDTAASAIGQWLEAGACLAYMSEGLFKLVPDGDTTVAGNGALWPAPSSFAAVLDDDSFIAKGKNDTVKISCPPWTEAWNKVQIQWANRASQYDNEITPESDEAAIERYGERMEDPVSYPFITTLPAATFAASMRIKRDVYNRNVYEFTTSWRYGYLEPTDVIGLTTSSKWAAGLNNPLGLSLWPVRITKKIDNPDGTIDWAAKDYIYGTGQATAFNKGTNGGGPSPNQWADPGDATVALMIATPRLLAGGFQNQLWIGAAGADENWGGCNVLVSMDGTKYETVGVIDSPARLGKLAADFATGSDPDTVNPLLVTLVDNAAPLEAATSSDADQNNTLCMVDGELISYSACSLIGYNQFTMGTYIRRGLLDTVIGAHANGSNFLRLDDAIFKYAFDASWSGKSVYLKFQSFNHFGNALQDLSELTAVEFNPYIMIPGVIIEFGAGQVTNVRPTFGSGGRLPQPPPGSRR